MSVFENVRSGTIQSYFHSPSILKVPHSYFIEMRKRTRAIGAQPKLIRIRIGDVVSDFELTPKSELPNRMSARSKARELGQIAAAAVQPRRALVPPPPERHEIEPAEPEIQVDSNVWNDLEDQKQMDSVSFLLDFPDEWRDFQDS
jgi:hypothetical protein